MDTGTAIFIGIAMFLAYIVRRTDKFAGNLMLFLFSAVTLYVTQAGADNTEIAISVTMTVLTLGNLIYSVFTAKK